MRTSLTSRSSLMFLWICLMLSPCWFTNNFIRRIESFSNVLLEKIVTINTITHLTTKSSELELILAIGEKGPTIPPNHIMKHGPIYRISGQLKHLLLYLDSRTSATWLTPPCRWFNDFDIKIGCMVVAFYVPIACCCWCLSRSYDSYATLHL